MKERSLAERIVAILGVLAGTIIWVVRLLFSMLQGVLKNLAGSEKDSTQASDDRAATGMADNVTQFASAARAKGESIVGDAKQRVETMVHSAPGESSGTSDPESGDQQGGILQPSPDDSPAPGITTGQHEDIGGIPTAPDMESAFGDPRDQDHTRPLEEQGFDEETGARLSQGIPNLEEPGGNEQDVYGSEAGALLDTDAPVSDYAGYAKSESDVGVGRGSQLSDLADTPDNDLQGGVDTYDTIDAGDTGSDEDQDAVDSAYENHVPTAGRGWQEPEDPLAGDPLYGDVDSSGTGDEVDLRNDEATGESGSGMHVVDSPDEPFLEDEPAVQEMGFVDTAGGTGSDATFGEVDDVTNLESAAVDEDSFASDALGNRIGGDAASGDLGRDESFDNTLREPGESVEDYDITGARTGSGVDEFADESVAGQMLSGTGDDVDGLGLEERDSAASDMYGGQEEDTASTESIAWASSAGVVDRDLTQPLPPDELQTGSDMSQAEAEQIIDADDRSGPPGSRKEVQDEFMIDGSESEAVKGPEFEEPQDAALRDVAAEMAEDIDVDGPVDVDETPGDSGQDVLLRGSGSVDTNAGQGETASRPRTRQATAPEGSVRGSGTAECPVEYPIKGNAKSRIYHRPSDPSYDSTIPEFCFATEADAKAAGFRARKL